MRREAKLRKNLRGTQVHIKICKISSFSVFSVDDGQKSDISTPAAITTPAAIIPPPNALEFAESVVESSGSPAPMKIVTTLQQKTITTTLNGVFEEDEEEEDTLHQIKKKIKPFEITREVSFWVSMNIGLYTKFKL